MLNLFNRNKANINSVSLPDFGWEVDKNDKSIKQWINRDQAMALSINFFSGSPDIPSVKKIELIRDYYRNQITQHNGGLIQVELVEIQNYDVIKTIFKIPQEGGGTTYLTSLTIPFEKCSYVIKIQAPEVEAPGIRDNAVAIKLKNRGEITVGPNGYENWSQDPYKPDVTKGTMMTRAEKEIYDLEFPNHPLSHSRQLMRDVLAGIEFSTGLEKIRRFDR